MRSNVCKGNTARPASVSSLAPRFTGSTLKGKKSRAALALAVSLWMANGGVASAANEINYEPDTGPVTKVTLGKFDWGAPGENLPEGRTTSAATIIDAANFGYTGTAINVLATGDTSTILNATELTTTTDDNPLVTGIGVNVDYPDDRGIRFIAKATGKVEVVKPEEESPNCKVQYRVTGVALKEVYLGGWNGTTSGVPQNWTGSGAAVYTGNFNALELAVGQSIDILKTKTANIFGTVSDSRVYSSTTFKNSEAGVTLSGHHLGDVKVEKYVEGNNEWENAKLTYYAAMDTTAIALGEMTWGTARDASGMAYNYAKVTDANLNVSGLTFTNPEDVTGTTTLLAANATLPAGLADVAKPISYQYNPMAGVTVEGAINGSVSKNGANIVYTATENKANKLTFGASIPWSAGTTYCDLSGKGYAFTFDGNTEIDAKDLTFTGLSYAAKAGDAMTLLANAAGVTGNHITQPTKASYEYTGYSPVSGVMIDGAVAGQVAAASNNVTFTVTENKATKLTFGNVAWKDSGALLDHGTTLTNVSFNGADVDTTNINFTNIQSLEANKKMTLVSDFGNSVGTITGAKYKVGSTLEGTGKASLVGNDLIFTAETGTSQEQTHNTVMGATVGMAALSAGNDFIGSATEGLSLASNVGADGVSSFAQMGGGSMRQETGSHVDTHTWNAILALGHQNKKERGTMEYGAFFEYGTGNYSTFNGDERGDGSTKYTGGGLLAKWTNDHGFYVEGSLRAGTVHDDARNVLRDEVTRMPYSYETDAPYIGFHLGVGKEIAFDDIHSLDVYGKYFYNRRNGVSFDAGGHYDLDAVTSQVVRVGARYTVKQDKWNFYGGVAYEHELDGKASGTVDGFAIRGADTSGGSFRGEIGATMKPGDNSPWSLDLNVSGFAGKKQGFTGGVSVAFMF